MIKKSFGKLFVNITTTRPVGLTRTPPTEEPFLQAPSVKIIHKSGFFSKFQQVYYPQHGARACSKQLAIRPLKGERLWAWGAECLFDMLGILFSKEGKKATQFDRRFNSLGIIFNLYI